MGSLVSREGLYLIGVRADPYLASLLCTVLAVFIITQKLVLYFIYLWWR